MLLHELMKIYTVEISQWKTSGSVEPLSITNKQIKTFDYRVLICIREQRILWLLNSIILLNFIITASLIFHPDKLNILLFLYNCYPATFIFFNLKTLLQWKFYKFCPWSFTSSSVSSPARLFISTSAFLHTRLAYLRPTPCEKFQFPHVCCTVLM